MKKDSESILLDWSSLFGFQDSFDKVVHLHKNKKLPQVILFSGREGIGKKLFLSKLAAFLLCDNESACGACPSCLDVIHGRHDELLWLDTDKTFKIEHALMIQDHLSMQASTHKVNGAFKVKPRVVVMPDMDRLNNQGANRLLKTLEEPSPANVILFSSSRPKQLLDTILSRVVRWHLEPPSGEESLSFLKSKVTTSLSDKQLEAALKQAGMAPWKALEKLEGSNVDEMEQVSRLIRDLLFSSSYVNGMMAAQRLIKDHQISVDDLTSRIELLLNRYYKWRLLGGQQGGDSLFQQNMVLEPSTVNQWRKSLATVRALTKRGRVPLNAQMIAETFALTR